jgi:NADH pyrophosphatase NudC (nudix superfamily)
MKYCPNCGKKLEKEIKVENKLYHQCSCGYIDWDNWVNVSAVVVARNDKDEILMVKMRKSQTYTFPGGFRDLGESLEEAAKRECFEETGFIIDDFKLLRVDTLDSIRLVWVIFEAKIIGGSFIENMEVDDIIFVKQSQLSRISPLRGSLTKRLKEYLE